MISSAIQAPAAGRASGGRDKSFIIDRFASRCRFQSRCASGHGGRAGNDGGRVVMAEATCRRREAPLSGRRDERRRRHRRRRGRDAVRDVAFSRASARKRPARRSTVDIGKLEPGQKIDIEWRGKVVWVINRTQADAGVAAEARSAARRSRIPNVSQQPADCKNEHRSIKDNVLVMVGICTHLGCSPTYRPEIAPADLGPDWLGGFFCPCHQSEVRPRGPRLLGRAGADQPAGAAAQVRDRHAGSSSANRRKSA